MFQTQRVDVVELRAAIFDLAPLPIELTRDCGDPSRVIEPL
jgi:hypothetical protein